MPSWSQEQLTAYEQRRRHNAAIAQQANVKAASGSSSAKPEQAVRDEPLAAAQGKEGDTRRCRVSIVSFRRRLIDPDNLCCKSFVDSLRYSGIIRDDTAKHIELHVRQEKAETDYTEIVVERITDSFGPYGPAGDAKWSGPWEGTLVKALAAIMEKDGHGLDLSPPGPCHDIAAKALIDCGLMDDV